MAPRVALAALLVVACTPRTPERGHDPIAPTVVEETSVVPDDAVDAQSQWAEAGAGVTCRADHFANLTLGPSAATFVTGLDATGIFGTSAWSELRPLVETGDVKAAIEIGQSCQLGVSSWRGVTVGFESATSQAVLVVRADGIGRPERLECMRAALEQKSGKSPWTIGTAANELAFSGGDLGIATDECTLVLITKNWVSLVRDRMVGGGSSVQAGALGSALARVDARKPVWIAAAVPQGLASGSPLDGARDFVASVELVGGMAIVASFTFADPAEATKRAGELQQQLDSMRSMFASMGLLSGLIDSARIVASGAQVIVQGTATDKDLRDLSGKLGPMIQRP